MATGQLGGAAGIAVGGIVEAGGPMPILALREKP